MRSHGAGHGAIADAGSDELAERLDAIQYEVDDGPCLTCLRTSTVIFVEDIEADPRWPAFSQRGHQEGAGTSLSVPLLANGGAVGALNLYARQPGSLTEEDHLRARKFAYRAAGAVALAVRLAEGEDRSRHLETALVSRTTIDQAIGILMGQARISADEAFAVPRLRSQHTNVKLRDIASEIVAEAAAGDTAAKGELERDHQMLGVGEPE